jgi:hypothetical protein
VITTGASTERIGRTTAATLCAVAVLSTALGVAAPAFAQTTPSPDPDPQIRPDPVTTQAKTTPSQRPVTRTPVVRSALQPVSSGANPTATVTASAAPSSASRVTVSARRTHPARRTAKAKPHPTRERAAHDPALVAVWRRLSAWVVRTPISRTLAATQPNDRSQARALSLAAIALLLVVIAGASLLRLTARLPRDVQRGRPA